MSETAAVEKFVDDEKINVESTHDQQYSEFLLTRIHKNEMHKHLYYDCLQPMCDIYHATENMVIWELKHLFDSTFFKGTHILLWHQCTTDVL